MSEHPIASARERTVWKMVQGPEGKVKRPCGTETLREAFCQKHFTNTSKFEGVNSSGWIFSCPGKVRGEQPAPHRFIADPPGLTK